MAQNLCVSSLRSNYDDAVQVNERLIQQLTTSNISVLDLREINMPFFPHDGHPTVAAHLKIATQIADAACIQDTLQSVVD